MATSKEAPKVSGVAMATPAVAVRPGAAPKIRPTTTPIRIQSRIAGSAIAPSAVPIAENRDQIHVGSRTVKP